MLRVFFRFGVFLKVLTIFSGLIYGQDLTGKPPFESTIKAPGLTPLSQPINVSGRINLPEGVFFKSLGLQTTSWVRAEITLQRGEDPEIRQSLTSDGEFHFVYQVEETRNIKVSCRINLYRINHAPETFFLSEDFLPGENPLEEISFELNSNLAGNLYAMDGKTPIQMCRVDLLPTPSEDRDVTKEAPTITDDRRSTLTDSFGRFSFYHLAPGSYRVSFHTPQGLFSLNEGEPIVLEADRPITDLSARTARFPQTQWRVFSNLDGFQPIQNLRDLYFSESGLIWLATSNGLVRTDGQKTTSFGESDGLISRSIRFIRSDNKGTLWAGSDGGLIRFKDSLNPSELRFESIEDAKGNFHSGVSGLATDSENRIWAASGTNLMVWKENTWSKIEFPVKDEKVKIRQLVRDLSGKIWVLSDSPTGSVIAKVNGEAVIPLDWKTGIKDFDSGQTRINSILPYTAEEVWLITQDGRIIRHDTLSGIFFPFGTQDGLLSNKVATVLKSSNDVLWVVNGESEKYLSRFDGEIWTHHLLPTHPVNLTSHHSWKHLSEDSNGRIWLTFGNTLLRFDAGRFDSFDTRDEVDPSKVTHLAIDPEGRLIAGGDHQWWVFTEDYFERIDQFDSNPDPNPIPNVLQSEKQHLHQWIRSSDGILWAATDRGLKRFENDQLAPLPQPIARLDSQVCYSLFEDSKKNLWIGLNNGIVHFDGLAAVHWELEDQLGPINAMVQTDDRSFWLATTTGIIRKRSTERKAPAPWIKVGNHPSSLSSHSKLQFAQNEQITFEWQAVDSYSPVDRRQFRYEITKASKLGESMTSIWSHKEGSAWKDPVSGNHFAWTPDAPGDYLFRVQYINQDLNYSEPSSIYFTVQGPPESSHRQAEITMISAAVLLLLVGAMGFILRTRNRELKFARMGFANQEKENKEAMNRVHEKSKIQQALLEDTREAAEQAGQAKSSFLAKMNEDLRRPIRAMLSDCAMMVDEIPTLNSGNAYGKPLRNIESTGKSLLHKIDGILDLAQLESGTMELDPEEFKPALLINEILELIRKSAEKSHIQLSFETKNASAFIQCDRPKFAKIIHTLLKFRIHIIENARLQIRLTKEIPDGKDWYRIEIRDNGKGHSEREIQSLFAPLDGTDSSNRIMQSNASYDLTVCRQMARLMGGELSMESERSSGSVMILKLPAIVRKR